MVLETRQRQAARLFAKEWSGKGYERGETQRFWLSLLHKVYGVANPMSEILFEIPVKTITKEKGSDFIDAYIPATKVLIEQKSSHVDLSAKSRQSDGTELTPYQQARRYAAGLPRTQYPRWKAHRANDAAVMEAYGFRKDMPEPEIVAELFKMYQKLTNNQ